MMWFGMVALTACMFVTPPRAGDGLPATDAHAFLNRTENCTCCHETSGREARLEPHAFTVDITESCSSCHTGEMLGSSHPVGVRADERYPDMLIPEELPVDAEERITCGTCHNPHLNGFSTERFASTQAPQGTRVEDGVEIAYYRTFRLRVHAPEAGNDPTCAACHAEHF